MNNLNLIINIKEFLLNPIFVNIIFGSALHNSIRFGHFH
jgi:hypothetical protein